MDSYKVVTGHVAVGPDQIGLVAADNRTRGIIGLNLGQQGHLHLGFAVHLQPERLMTGTSSLLLLLSRRAQLPSKISLTGYRLSHVTCRNAPPPAIGVILHEEVCQVISIRQDKTRRDWNP